MQTAIATTNNQVFPSQADSDEQLVALWLHGRPKNTVVAYRRDIERLLAHTGKSLASTTLADLQSFVDDLEGSDNTRKRTINAVKSLLSFGQKVGYLTWNVGAPLKAPKPKSTLAQRILSESDVHRMIAFTSRKRDRVLLTVLYASAARVSELCSLVWNDCQPNGSAGQVTLYGKGGKTRAVVVSKATWAALVSLRPAGAAGTDPVFVSQKGGSLDESQVHRIVATAAERAGIEGNVSPHWLRHSHASHAIDRGATVVLVRDTLGHSSLAVTSMYAHAKPTESSALHLSV
jgi:integrase/recombinase XerD